jgi:homocysteine S-methyltransferase
MPLPTNNPPAPPAPPILILDGGLGTTLEGKYHIRFTSADTPLWSSHLLLSQPGLETLSRCHADFLRAGADIVSTATYQASVAGFRNTRTDEWPDGVPADRVPGYLSDAVGIASRACEDAAAGAEAGAGVAAVSLSLGPYGATIVPSQEYGGVYDEDHCGSEKLAAWHTERLGLFCTVDGSFARVDYVAFETVPRLDEVLGIRRAMEDETLLSRVSQDRPTQSSVRYWISCVFTQENEEGAIIMPDGTTAAEVAEAMLDPRVSSAVPWGIGINCTKVDKLPILVDEFGAAVAGMVKSRRVDDWPALVLYPDGTNGEVYDTVTQKWELPRGVEAPKVRGQCYLPSTLTSYQPLSLLYFFSGALCYHWHMSLTMSSNRGRANSHKSSRRLAQHVDGEAL